MDFKWFWTGRLVAVQVAQPFDGSLADCAQLKLSNASKWKHRSCQEAEPSVRIIAFARDLPS